MKSELSVRQLEIIEAAGKILSTAGVSGLTIKNLAKEMKFSESALYRHFKGKEDILVSMLNFLAESMNERFLEISELKISPEDKFITLFNNQFEFFNLKPYFVVAVFTDGLLEESDKINEAILNLMAVKMKFLLPVITAGQEQEIFTSKIKTEEILHITMGAFRLLMFKWRISNYNFNIIEKGSETLASVLTLIKVK